MPGLIKCSWNDVRNSVSLVNPELKEIIDDLSPSNDHALYMSEYPYGALIVENGVFRVMNDAGKLVPLYHSSIDSKVKKDLGYAGTMPVGIIADNSIETFFMNGHRPVPSAFYTKGSVVSVWEILEGKHSYQDGPLWNISAGARTICMLPKITDKTGNDNLKRKYQFQLSLANSSLSNHWAIFRAIANHNNFSQFHWRSKIIYFSKNWFDHAKDKSWDSFYRFMLMQAWQDPLFKRNQFVLDLAFYLAQKDNNLKPNPYLADTVRHLIQLGTGNIPGLMPAINDIAAPVSGLQEAYLEDYGLKKLPVIMHSHHFSLEEDIPIYYSLQLPTTAAFSTRSSKIYSKMSDLRELKGLLGAFLSEIAKGLVEAKKRQLANLARDVAYNFYHCEDDRQGEILSASRIIDLDSDFYKTPFKIEGLDFADFAPFFRGCISISKK